MEIYDKFGAVECVMQFEYKLSDFQLNGSFSCVGGSAVKSEYVVSVSHQVDFALFRDAFAREECRYPTTVHSSTLLGPRILYDYY